MQTTKEKVLKDASLRRYSDLINKIAKVEYRSIASAHLIEFDELVSIGLQTINVLCKEENFENFNESYLSTAIKWAIRNELRNRYKWYGVRQQKTSLTEDERSELRDAIYKTVLSTDEIYDGERTFEIKDIRKNPEENCEFSMLSTSIKSAVMTLPQRERELIECKFFQDKKLHELSDEFSISPSRISRIIKQGLDKIKDELVKNEIV
ncbi:MAG: sigma-70 family RNA polymerase sigma factor [Candidatus Gastranaerophilales bacterium]|nr:sigma-70 family RNA polymerase sigma factor [Candidatus Gastranaerophilales bacterium]